MNIFVSPRFPKKRRLGPQNDSGSFRTQKTAKNSQLPKFPENYFEPVGKCGWPPISTWINLSTSCFSQASIDVNNLSIRVVFSTM
jgi:hypothetical protein